LSGIAPIRIKRHLRAVRRSSTKEDVLVKTKPTAIVAALILALVLATAGCSSDSQQEAAPADFYKGKTIDLVATAGAGARTDLVTRVIASFLERDTGANVVVTDRSGAGGLDGMNYLYGAEPDGLTLGVTASVKFVANKVLDEPAATYDLEDFSYLMNVGRMLYYFMVSPDGPYQSVADLRAGENLKIGGSSPSGAVSLGGLSVIELLDLDASVVTGIKGESNRAPAVKRGEIIGYVIGVETARSSIESGMVKPLFVLAPERAPRRPDVPAITELADLTGEDLALVELWETSLVSSDLLAAPPGVPEDRLAFLRGLAEEWAQDPEFRAEINQVFGSEVQEYATGEAVTSSMQDLAAAVEEFQALFAEMIEKYRA